MPNSPETIIAMLRTTSIGAVWSSCGPDFGTRGVLDRYSQLAPKVMFCVDGYQYGGKPFERKAEVQKIIGQLDSLRHVVYLPYLNRDDRQPLSAHTLLWDELLQHPAVPAGEFKYEQCRSSIRCGYCSLRVRRACPSPSATVTAASFSSSSSTSHSTSTCYRASGCSSSPRPAG